MDVRHKDKPKSPRFYGKRASLILAEYRYEFLRNFQELEGMELATDLRVVGSVATGHDTCKSDIDFLVKVKDDSMPVWHRIQQALADWIAFPVHVTLEREGIPLPECMLRQAIPLEKWRQYEGDGSPLGGSKGACPFGSSKGTEIPSGVIHES